MPRWYISRPINNNHESELIAYTALTQLGDEWTIRWGYHYLDNSTTREGDFLILGPDGRLLVLEVKKEVRLYPRTGMADGGVTTPAEDQVLAQKAGVLKALETTLSENPKPFELPFITPAIFSVKGQDIRWRDHAQPISVLCGKEVLKNLPKHWEKLTSGGHKTKNLEAVKRLFAKVYGDASEKAEAKFLNATDRLLLDRLSSDGSLLESLAANRQILIQGGAGSGKTWLAERLARKWAEEGLKVLFLCYNKALGAQLAKDFPKMLAQGIRGTVTVHTWESLSRFLIEKCNIELPPIPTDRKEQIPYYDQTIPDKMLEAVTNQRWEPMFDAIVVDEAQDHNTADNNWWEIYLSLLKEGRNARTGVFYDEAQRPSFRSGTFQIADVAKLFSQPAYFSLRKTRRYTRPIFDYLASLQSNETNKFISGLHDDDFLTGPDVTIITEESFEKSLKTAQNILENWFKNNYTLPSETLVLFRQDPFEGKEAPFAKVNTFAGKKVVTLDTEVVLDDNLLRVGTYHKSKGLDARAVVLLGSWPWEDLPAQQREAFWIAASRARQLLAVIAKKKKPKNNTDDNKK